MRTVALCVLVGVSALSAADRVIQSPTATKIRYRQIRAEYRFEPTRPKNNDVWLGYGLDREVEIEAQIQRREGKASLGTFNASYLFITPVMDAAPGISFGVRDALDRTDARRLWYMAVTFRYGLEGQYNQRTPMEVTAGFGFGKRSGIFTGVTIPFTWQFRLIAEYDLTQPRAGFEYWTHQGFSVRTIFERGTTNLAVRYVAKF